MDSKQLEAAATALLRKAGCRADGRRSSEARGSRDDAMHRAVRCPFSGKSRKNK